MKLVVVESPFAGDVLGNIAYAKRCVADSLRRGESPYASHLFFTQEGILDDTIPSQRKRGVEAGFAWGRAASIRAIYVDRGFSSGMTLGIEEANRIGQQIDFRSLDGSAVEILKKHIAKLSLDEARWWSKNCNPLKVLLDGVVPA